MGRDQTEKEKSTGSPQSAGAAKPVLELTGISKRYGDVVANDRVDFDLREGEIHVLLGENGAGKTTLLNAMFGHICPDAGSIRVRGEEVRFNSPHDALARGIGMVHQHFSLVSTFTVAENVMLGVKPAWQGLRPAAVRREVEAFLDELGWDMKLNARVGDLPIEAQQRVEIVKLLYRGVTTLLLDEPTSLLAPPLVEALHETLLNLKRQGVSMVLVTHKLSEVMEIGDRVTVLRNGRRVAMVKPGEFDERSLARAMTGGDLDDTLPARAAGGTGDVAVSAEGLFLAGADGRAQLDGLSLSIRRGEILGVAGVEGNGQNELVEVLAGLRCPKAGRVLIDGRDVTGWDPATLRRAGVGIIPADRRRWGLVPDMTLAENLALTGMTEGARSRFGFVNLGRMRAEASRLLEEFNVEPRDPDLPCNALSGGNQQKLVLARELAKAPQVLVASSPTWGLDVGAIDFVHRRLVEAREAGCAILLASVDLDEILKLSDRVVVLYRGRVLLEQALAKLTREDVAMAMIGRAPESSR